MPETPGLCQRRTAGRGALRSGVRGQCRESRALTTSARHKPALVVPGGCQTATVENSFNSHQHRRGLFSSEAEAYDRGRPGYPDRVYELLVQECGLGPATRVLEIGPGTGQATTRLLDLGASVTAVELGVELADRLEEKLAGRDLIVKVGAFEDFEFLPGSFDVVVAATSFHWVPTEHGLYRCADALPPGGWLALFWSSFGDPNRPDPFHDALSPILERLAPTLLDTPSAGAPGCGPRPFYALDSAARRAEIGCGRFGPVRHEVISWTGRHTPEELRLMFASFSPLLALPSGQRTVVLDALEELARSDFGGVVERPYLTSVYLAPRVP